MKLSVLLLFFLSASAFAEVFVSADLKKMVCPKEATVTLNEALGEVSQIKRVDFISYSHFRLVLSDGRTLYVPFASGCIVVLRE